jgi:Ca2+-binding EF-hand superfamily protein
MEMDPPTQTERSRPGTRNQRSLKQLKVHNPMLSSLTMNASVDSAVSDASSVPSAADAAEVFKLVDFDGDGRLVQEELEPFFSGLGLHLSLDDKQRMLKSMDADGDGEITLSEFQRWWASAGKDGSTANMLFSKLDEKKQAETLFQMADKGDTGEISWRQFRHLVRRLGIGMSKAQIDEAIAEMDEEESGLIGFEDFLHWWSTEKILEKDMDTKKKASLANTVSAQLFQEFKYRLDEKEALVQHMEALGVDKFAEEMKNKWTTLGVVAALLTGMAYDPLMAPAENDGAQEGEEYVVVALGASFACSVSCVLLSTIFYVHLAFVPAVSQMTQSGKVVPGVTEFVEGMSAWDLHSPDVFLVMGIVFLLASVILKLHLDLYIVLVVSPHVPSVHAS